MKLATILLSLVLGTAAGPVAPRADGFAMAIGAYSDAACSSLTMNITLTRSQAGHQGCTDFPKYNISSPTSFQVLAKGNCYSNYWVGAGCTGDQISSPTLDTCQGSSVQSFQVNCD